MLRARPLLLAIALLASPLFLPAQAQDPLPVPLGGDEARAGRWDAPMPWPVQAEFSALLPTGKVLLFVSGADAHLWDPATGGMTPVPGGAVNCAGLAHLPDGRVLVHGGHRSAWRGVPDAWIFDPWRETWSRADDMRVGRYYPGSLALPDGHVLSVSGNAPEGVDAPVPETYDPATGAWTARPTAALPMEFYPRMHALPDGRVARTGQDGHAAFLDVGTWTWREGPVSRHGPRWGGASVLLPGLDRVLVFGGGSMGASSEGWGPLPALRDDAGRVLENLARPLHDPGASPATARAEILDLRGPAPAWRETGAMTYPRRDHAGVLLPDGTVLAVGGASGFEPVPGWAEHALHPERYDPATGAWSLMAPADRHRGYHSTAILLPDATVLVGGGDFETGAGSVPGADRTGQVFRPPYLFQGPRPVLLDAPAHVAWGQSFAVRAEGDVAGAALVRLGWSTHSMANDQRLVGLDAHAAGPFLVLAAPATPREAPPGWYMLFLLSGEGVPSVARMVHVGR